MVRLMVLLCGLAVLLTACPKQPKGTSSTPAPVAAVQQEQGPTTEVPAEITPEQSIARGQEIFTGTAYSKTGLTCAMCHSMSPTMDEGKIYIASNAYTAARRGTWRVKSQAAQAAGTDGVNDLIEAVNMCVTAPYMNNGEKLTPEDANAIQTFLKSIDTKVEGGDKLVPALDNYPMPAAGLTPDREHGKVIYETSCKFCHDNGIKDLPSLAGAKDWLTPIQVMAKVRKVQGDWFNDYKTQTYACANPLARQLALLGISVAYAEEAGATPPPSAAAPPAGEPGAAPPAEATAGTDEIFPENAMPGYPPEILTDQDVVDVAFYVAEEL
jgi:mono/diheme cytochrome c family protein